MAEEVLIGDGAGLDILCASAVRAALIDCAESFHKSTGTGVRFRFDTSGGVDKRATAYDIADIFASSRESIETIADRGRVIGMPVIVGASRIAMGVRANETAPDISTVEKFKAVMLAAKKISRGDPAGGGTAGNYLVDMLKRIGLLDAIADKSILRVGGYNVMKEVAENRADFGLTQSTEIVAVAGVKIGAWLPEDLQLTTFYAVARGGLGPHRPAAAAFLAHVAGPEGKAAFARGGFAPA